MASNPAILFEFAINLDHLDNLFPPLQPLAGGHGIGYAPPPSGRPLVSQAEQTLLEQARHPARTVIVGGLSSGLSSSSSLGNYFPDIATFSEGFGVGPSTQEKGAVWLTDPPTTADDIQNALAAIDLLKDASSAGVTEVLLLVFQITADGLRTIIDAIWAKMQKSTPTQYGTVELVGVPTLSFDNTAKCITLTFDGVLHGGTFPNPWDQNFHASESVTFGITNTTVTKAYGGTTTLGVLTTTPGFAVNFDTSTEALDVAAFALLVSNLPFLTGSFGHVAGGVAGIILVPILTGHISAPSGVSLGPTIANALPNQFLIASSAPPPKKILLPYLDVEVSEATGLEFFCGEPVTVDRQPAALLTGPTQLSGGASASGIYQITTQDLRPNPTYQWSVTGPGSALPNPNNPSDPSQAQVVVSQQSMVVRTQGVVVSATVEDSDQQKVSTPPVQVMATFTGIDAGDEGGLDTGGYDSKYDGWTPPPEKYTVQIVSYDKGGVAGKDMTNPLIVRVTDSSGHGAAGVFVAFGIVGPTTDGRVVTPTLTDANGFASTVVTLGRAPGTYSVQITVEGYSQSVEIMATVRYPLWQRIKWFR
jgi:hypothetical protein